MSRDALDEHRLRRLIEVGRRLVSELDPEAVLQEVVEVARELTGARYAAVGILDESRHGLERFIYRGIDEQTRAVIGDLPRGRGVLGVLIEDPKPLRLSDVGEHPKSFGFPAGHPPMRNFLGVPIIIRGEAFGNLYLTEKAADDFNDADEQAVTILAEWAAIAIDNARLYSGTEKRRRELERAVRGLEATTDIARAIGSETELQPILDMVAKRGRALVEAKTLMILLEDHGDLVVTAAAGEQAAELQGKRMPSEGSATGEVLRTLSAERVPDIATRLRISTRELGIRGNSAILVPLSFQGRALGVISALDRLEHGPEFDEEDERLLTSFAASAATAVATAQSVNAERHRQRIRATEEERGRWARELHDETLQGIAARRVVLSSALRQGGEELASAVAEAVEGMTSEIENLRALITELRPATLDEIGLSAALEGLVERFKASTGIQVVEDVAIASGAAEAALDPDLEVAVYRVAQEALTNVTKHADATRVELTVRRTGGQIEIEVTDDGAGFDPGAESSGFGIAGMKERVELAGGGLEIATPDGGGTRIRAALPVALAAPDAGASPGRPEGPPADQVSIKRRSSA